MPASSLEGLYKPCTGRTGQCMNMHWPYWPHRPHTVYMSVLYTKQGGHQTVNEKHAPSPLAATANAHRPSNCSNF